MAKNRNVQAVGEAGQSLWYDNLSLDVLRSGELQRLLEEGVSGLTSNPTIFKKAIADTSHYDEKIVALRDSLSSSSGSAEGVTEEICESLMVDDVAAAADLLMPVFEASGGEDGYASIEVSPRLAHDTAGTVAAAERLWKKLDRPNIMIKIPATEAGIPAIREVLSQGIPVNVTLIFSVEVYRQVISAFLEGVAQIESADRQKKIASVASFFVSRVDAAVEKEISARGSLSTEVVEQLVGKVGIANSKLAYELFEEVFRGEEFSPLREQGVPVQRPLWASTGTKNPSFPELLYVEALVGKDTVNTLPPATLQSLLERSPDAPPIRGELHDGLSEAKKTLQLLEESEIDLSRILSQLQEEGVRSFSDSYEDLLRAVAEKQKALSNE
ncbi:transaldolase [bacterium]|nr:transaldolase [bacterium]